MKRPTPMRTRLAAKSIGESITTWRKLRGITMEELAQKANTTRATIGRLEHGDPSVSLSTFLNVCGTLGLIEGIKTAVDPFETDFGRMRADQNLPQRVRK